MAVKSRPTRPLGQERSISVLGGAGVMGQRLVQGLLDRGEQVRVLDRPGTKVADPRVDLRHGDVTDPSTLHGVFDGIKTTLSVVVQLMQGRGETGVKVSKYPAMTRPRPHRCSEWS